MKIEAWITKYLLTKGIYKVSAEKCRPEMIKELDSKWGNYFHGKEWHATEADAKAHAAVIIAAKRKSIARQIASIDKMEKLILGK